ncbi:MAG: GNAT family N-acetyltransferase [Gammaproteobacteria bacterium]|jgi:ElaA protein|nr:GNAT family N-acetyltransferase [Gammaproteobacteria bacterium]HJO10619.1 GNAT family N-acetyltransferase [Gammaproteobacteria bacterium]|tara:strand:- start:399 stop:851 length:453 start_codon:yes stop_codon:yes gene_type:complete
MSDISWTCDPFGQLTNHQLYALLQLRTEVFVMEQNCAYQDMDDLDQKAFHVQGLRDGKLICYGRLLAPGVKYAEPAIGRIICILAMRREGLGRLLMYKTMAYCEELWPGQAIRISAQHHLESFYNEFGFTAVSEPYMEDGIPHIEMLIGK